MRRFHGSTAIRRVIPLLALSLCGCIEDRGLAPPEGRPHFPVAVALSPSDPGQAPDYLYLASSNFDLLFNSGTVHAYDLDVLNDALDDPATCATVEDRARCAIVPSQLVDSSGLSDTVEVFPTDDLLLSEVRIGSFADGIAVAPDGRRLYLPVRSDGNLTFIDVEDGIMRCGGTPGQVHSCTDAFRSGDKSDLRNLSLPADPVDVHVGSLADDFGVSDGGDYVLMAHRGGEVSLFLDRVAGLGTRPTLVFSAGGLETQLVTVSVDPNTGLAWLPSAANSRISRVGIALDGVDGDGDLSRSFLFNAGARRLRGLDTGTDARQIQFDPRPGVRRGYVLSRIPEALLVVRTDTVGGDLELEDVIPVGRGPSRVEVLEIGGVMLAFVTCFNAREVHIIAVDQGLSITTVEGVSGAFELAVDVVRSRMYVVDFRTSVLRVYDLEPLVSCIAAASMDECAPQLVGLLGRPRAVEELR